MVARAALRRSLEHALLYLTNMNLYIKVDDEIFIVVTSTMNTFTLT